MTWRNPLFTPSSAVTGVRIAARSKSVKHDAMAVHLTLGRDLMRSLGFTVGEKVRLWVGDGPHAGWVRLTLPAGMDGTNLTIGTGGGGGRLAGGLVQFSARYLQGAAVVEKMTAIDAEHRVDGDGLDVRLPEGWVASQGAIKGAINPRVNSRVNPEAPSSAVSSVEQNQGDAPGKKGDKTPLNLSPLFIAPPAPHAAPVEPEPEPAADDETGANYAGNYAEAMPAAVPAGAFGATPKLTAHKNGGPWEDDDPTLRRMFSDGADIKAIAAQLGRTPGAVQTRLYTLGLKGPKKGGVEPPVKQNRTPRVAVHAPATADKPVKRVATVTEDRRPLARRPAGDAPPTAEAIEARRAMITSLREPLAFLADAGIKVEPATVAGMWFVDGEMVTARQVVQQANSLRTKAGLDPRYTLDDRTDRVTASGQTGSSLTNMGA